MSESFSTTQPDAGPFPIKPHCRLPRSSSSARSLFSFFCPYTGMDLSGDRSEIVFFDVETTVPTRTGQGFSILEFGAILVCPRKLEELESYSTLVRPADLSLISSLSVRCNGITHDAVVSAPTFGEICDKVYNLLHGRIWAGHNILRFDCARIREAFAEIGKPAPEPKGLIDSLALLTQKFGRRAGDMKMATLATYFGLGQQKHRSLDDVRMNLEVVKHCATVLFLESSLPDIFTANSWVSPNATTRSRSNGKTSSDGKNKYSCSSSLLTFESIGEASLANQNDPTVPTGQRMGVEEIAVDVVASSAAPPDPFSMGPLSNELKPESLKSDVTMDEEKPLVESEGCSGSASFLEPDEVSIPSIHVSLVPFFRGTQKIRILYKNAQLQLCCSHLRVKFGLSTKFVDHAGRPRLSFVVDASPGLCRVLDACDDLSQKILEESCSLSEWRPVVMRKDGFINSPTVRLHIPIVVEGENVKYGTEMHQKESSGSLQKLVFSKVDAAELDTLFAPGTFVDASFSLDAYDYQLNAGIRLVAKTLTILSG